MNQMLSKIFNEYAFRILDDMAKHPESVSEADRSLLEKLYSALCAGLHISEHSRWCVDWQVEKWHDTKRKEAGFEPDEIAYAGQNIILDSGANEMLKLISGTGGTAYSSANTYIYVGTNTTAENAAQSGVLATGSNRAYAKLDSGYPVVNGRQVIYRASFGDSSANFTWNESSIVNGVSTSAVAMNRKMQNLGTKNTGTWTIQITVSLTST